MFISYNKECKKTNQKYIVGVDFGILCTFRNLYVKIRGYGMLFNKIGTHYRHKGKECKHL